LGVKAGPRLGEIMRDLEKQWVEEGFLPDRGALIERATSLLRN
jgi:poly(A) polymerase